MGWSLLRIIQNHRVFDAEGKAFQLAGRPKHAPSGQGPFGTLRSSDTRPSGFARTIQEAPILMQKHAAEKVADPVPRLEAPCVRSELIPSCAVPSREADDSTFCNVHRATYHLRTLPRCTASCKSKLVPPQTEGAPGCMGLVYILIVYPATVLACSILFYF